MFRKVLFSAAAVLSLSLPASAAAVLVDDFNYGSDEVLNAPDAVFGGNWQTVDGSVDYLARPNFFGNQLCGLTDYCVDLDGSTKNAGLFRTVRSFGEGLYAMTFQILGSHRGTVEEVTIGLGSLTHTFTIESNGFANQMGVWGQNGFTSFGSIFSAIQVGPGGSQLWFQNSGGDNIGALLKSVSLDTVPAPVPLPAGGLLLASAFAALGLLRRRALAKA